MFFSSSRKVTTMLSDGLLHDFGPSSMVMSVNGTNASSLAVPDPLHQHTGVTTSQIPACKDSHHARLNLLDRKGSQASTPDSVPSLQSQNSLVILRSDSSQPAQNRRSDQQSILVTQSDPFYNLMVHSQELEQPASAQALRAKPIAIKRSRPDDDVFEDNSTERMYDFATWRMYHRITSARRPQSFAPHRSYCTEPSGNTSSHGISLEVYPHASPTTRRIKSLSDLSMDGEVFVLDI